MSDIDKIIKGCIKNEPESQKKLYLMYANSLYSVCYRYAFRKSEAEDLLQETFIKIYMNIKSYSGKGSFEGWMRRIAVNVALKNYNSSKNCELNFESYITDAEEPGNGNNVSICDDTTSSINYKDLLQFIDWLPAGKKVIFNMYAIEGYDHGEIAAMLKITESTSRSQLTKARELLQELHRKHNKTYERKVS